MTIRPQKWSGIYGGICVLIDPSFAEQQSSEAQALERQQIATTITKLGPGIEASLGKYFGTSAE